MSSATAFRSELGYKIFLDRYALKDSLRGSLSVGSLVLFRSSDEGQKEIGHVIELPTDPNGLVQVSDDVTGESSFYHLHHLDLPLETEAQQMFDRVAKGCAAVESSPMAADYWAAKFSMAMADWKFVPAGRILTGCGTDQNLTFQNCFVLPSPNDSRHGIIQTLDQMGELMSRGGGVGINLSTLRPKYAYVQGVNGRSSGSVSWGSLYSFVTGLIEQGGTRRGALMLILDDWHPDLLDFINAKREIGKIENANISVGISDEFMAAVAEDENWTFEFPDTSHPDYDSDWDGDLVGWKSAGYPTVVHATRKAREIWNAIIESAWSSAEPGVWFRGQANRLSNSWYYNRGRLICTNPCVTGDTLIATVERGPVPFEQLAREGQDVKVWSWDPTHKQACVRWMRRPHKTREDAELLEVEFDSGLKLRLTPDHSLYTFRGKKVKARDLKIGKSVRAYAVSTHKDGQQRVHNGDSGNKYAHRLVWEEANGPIPEDMIVHHKNEDPADNRLENLELLTPEQHNSTHYPSRHANGLRGHDNFPEVLQKARERKELGVGNHKVVAIREAGRADVYNGMVEGTHTYVICDPEYRGASGLGVFSGIVSANCGEQSLPGWAVCNLGHINLAQFVKVPFTESKVPTEFIDWESLGETVAVAVRFLDNIIDATPYFFEDIKSQQLLERRIGLGTMGLAEMLVRLGVAYGSELSHSIVKRVYAFIRDRAYETSIELAQEKGPFKAFDSEKFLQSPFIQDLPQVIREKIQQYGIRNVTLLTQAPTGTVGTMVGTSTGIEPFFDYEFVRKGRLGTHTVQETVFQEWLEMHPDQPRASYLVTAMQLSPREHVAIQGLIQQYTDSSISKTCNVPESYTVEETRELYELMYKLKCKGGTVYRDNSRHEQVLERVILEAPKQPIRPHASIRAGVTRTESTPAGMAHITLNHDAQGVPLECFVGIGKAGSDIQGMSEALGRLVSLILRLDSGVAPMEKVQAIVEQLQGIGGARSIGFGPNKVRSIPDALARALQQQWLPQPVNEPLEEKLAVYRPQADLCPDCGQITLTATDGCESCYNCGFSYCG